MERRRRDGNSCSDEFQHPFVSRMVGRQRAAKFERVIACGVRQFVDEGLDDKCIVRMADRAPPQTRHAPGAICQSTSRFEIPYGMSFAPSTAVSSTPSFITADSNGVPTMNDWQTMRCCHASGLPSAPRPARME